MQVSTWPGTRRNKGLGPPQSGVDLFQGSTSKSLLSLSGAWKMEISRAPNFWNWAGHVGQLDKPRRERDWLGMHWSPKGPWKGDANQSFLGVNKPLNPKP